MYDRINQALLESLSHKQDKAVLSEKMGYSYNQFFKLEAGYKKFKLSDFVKLCQIRGDIDLVNIFNKSFDIQISDFDQQEILENICDAWGAPSHYLIENELEISTSKWWRLKNGKSSINLDDFFRLIDALSGRLVEFLKFFLSAEKISELFQHQNTAHQILMFLQKYPQSSLITTGLYTEVYLHSEPAQRLNALCELTGLNKDEFDFLVTSMLSKGILYEEDGILKGTIYKTELKSQEIEVGKSVLDYMLTNIQKENLLVNTEKGIEKKLCCTYKIASVSQETKLAAIEEMKKCYRKVSELIESDNNSHRDQLIMFEQAILKV